MKAFYFLLTLVLIPSVLLAEEISPNSAKPAEPQEVPLQFSGDLRIRHQVENKNTNEERRIQRLQARLALLASIQSDLKVYLRMLTGKDAVSGNLTMGDPKAAPMARRDFGLDLAYFEYQPFPVWTVFGGKMVQPFLFVGKNQMILDRDISPEGFATKLQVSLAAGVDFFLNAGSFWVRENYDDSIIGQGVDQTDSFLNGIQLGIQGQVDQWSYLINTGSFANTAVKDQPITNFGTNLTTVAQARGNTLYSNGGVNTYPTNFDVQEQSIEVRFKEKNWQVGVFAEQIRNIDTDTLNKGQALGFFGNYLDFGFSWTTQELQKDAVMALFTDSDFAGGETSSKGTVWAISYRLSKKVLMTYTYFDNKAAIETDSPTNYKRTHLDLLLSF